MYFLCFINLGAPIRWCGTRIEVWNRHSDVIVQARTDARDWQVSTKKYTRTSTSTSSAGGRFSNPNGDKERATRATKHGGACLRRLQGHREERRRRGRQDADHGLLQLQWDHRQDPHVRLFSSWWGYRLFGSWSALSVRLFDSWLTLSVRLFGFGSIL